MHKLLAFVWIAVFLNGCTPEQVDDTMAGAYVPVYALKSTTSTISVQQPRPVVAAGKIYVFGNWLFENDVNTGIHIIDISDKAKPRKIAFLSVPFSTEVAVKGNFLYTNNFDDLLAFNISNPTAPVLSKRIEGVFPLQNQHYPPFQGVLFECADASKGLVVEWQLKQIKRPKCRR